MNCLIIFSKNHCKRLYNLFVKENLQTCTFYCLELPHFGMGCSSWFSLPVLYTPKIGRVYHRRVSEKYLDCSLMNAAHDGLVSGPLRSLIGSGGRLKRGRGLCLRRVMNIYEHKSCVVWYS